jgi:three-Cys-motif partner protein
MSFQVSSPTPAPAKTMSSKYEWCIGSPPPILDDHSAAKHDVLRQYVGTYVEVLTANPRRDILKLTLVDGLAGGGNYLRNGLIVPGSPFIILDELAAAEVRINAERTKPLKLDTDFIFVEKIKGNFAYLELLARQSKYHSLLGDRLHLLQIEFEKALPSIIARIKSRGKADRAIFFLDQYGYSDISFDAIRTILSQLANPEIILTFNVDWLIDYLSKEEAFLKAVKPVELSLTQVLDLLNMKNQKEARWLIQNMLYKHLITQTQAPYYTPFFIKSAESHRSYWLVHISKHPTARDEMAALHWRLQNHFVHHGRSGLRMLGFDPERAIEQIPFDFVFDDNARARSLSALSLELPRRVFNAHRADAAPPTLLQLFQEICNETPATKDLVSEVIVELRAQNELEIVSSDGRLRPRAITLDDHDRVLPAKQRDIFSPLTPLLHSE